MLETEQRTLDAFLEREEIGRLFTLRRELIRFQRVLGPMHACLASGARPGGAALFSGLHHVRRVETRVGGGVLLFGGCHGTLAYAEKYASSGLAAVMLGTIPFWIVLIKFVISAEDRPKTITLAALIPSLAGVALFMLPTEAQDLGPISPEMVLILLGSAFLWALVH